MEKPKTNLLANIRKAVCTTSKRKAQSEQNELGELVDGIQECVQRIAGLAPRFAAKFAPNLASQLSRIQAELSDIAETMDSVATSVPGDSEAGSAEDWGTVGPPN